jgi:uncharacterized lipoprotein YmbA
MLVGMGPIRFPGYLDRQEVVIRSAQNRFEVSENDRWAEPLEENFARILSENLAVLLNTDLITVHPWTAINRPRYQVEIEVLRFEANNERNAQLLARWTVLAGGDKKVAVLREFRALRNAKEKSMDASVAALSDTVGDLSREIAAAIGELDKQKKPNAG